MATHEEVWVWRPGKSGGDRSLVVRWLGDHSSPGKHKAEFEVVGKSVVKTLFFFSPPPHCDGGHSPVPTDA